MQRSLLRLLFPALILAVGLPAFASPEITVEVSGLAHPTGSQVNLASPGLWRVSDPVEFTEPDGPLTISFTGVVPGVYEGQLSGEGEFWSPFTSPVYHPATGTLTFTHDPGPVATVFYRLFQTINDCEVVTLRNTGDMPLTGIAAALGGVDAADFTLDDSALATSLAPGETTALTVCFTANDAQKHLATLSIASDDPGENPFTLALVGDNDPGPLQAPAPTVTVFTNRASFEAAVGAGKLVDDFSKSAPVLPVVTARGAIANGKWADIAREPEPSTTWGLPLLGTTGWGGKWDLTVAGQGGGLAFELDFGGGNLVTVPSHLAPGSAADVFFGFTADQPFFGVRVRQFDSVGNTLQETHSFDDMTVQITNRGEIAVHDGSTELSDGQPAPVEFGSVARQSTAARTLTLSNSSSQPLDIFAILTGGNFAIAGAPATPFTLAPGGSVNFDVVVTTGGGGTYAGEVCVFSSDADETRFDFNVTASVPSIVEIEISNTQDGSPVTDGQAGVIHFEASPFAAGTSVTLLIENTGPDALQISSVSLPPGFVYALGVNGLQAPRAVAPGEQVGFSITCTGPGQGVYQGVVTLLSNDADEGEFTFPIRALFNMPEIEVLNPLNQPIADGGMLDFGTTPRAQDKGSLVRVRNLHAGPLTVTGVNLPPNYQLGASAPPFPFTLGRNEIRDIPLRLLAANPGTFTGTMQIFNNDDDEGPFDIALTGVVSEDSITFLGFNLYIPEGQSFGAFAFGQGPVTYEWDLDGDGEFDDAVGSTINLPGTDGPDNLPASLRMTDNLTSMVRSTLAEVRNGAPFVSATVALEGLVGEVIALDATASDVPADVAAGMAWRLDWGDGAVETTPAGHAVATSFSHAYSEAGEAFISIGATDKDGGTGSTQRVIWIYSAVIGVFDGADTSGEQLRDGLGQLSFTAVLGGTEDHQLTVLNRSAGPAQVGPVTLPAGFSLVSPPAFPATLAPGAALTLTLRFAPTQPGSFGGEFSMATSDPAMPSFEIALSGSAVAPDILVSHFFSERFDFASGEQSFEISPGSGSFNGESFRIESTDFDAPLSITAIELPPSFQLSTAPAFPIDFSEQSSLDLRIQCHATVTGFYEGWVSLISNDPDESPFRFYLRSRVGDLGDLLVKSDGGDLSSATGIIVSGQSEAIDATAPLTLRLHNQGNRNITVTSITLPPDFVFASPPALPITLSLFASATLPDIMLSATAPGSYVGIVSIISDDPDENPYEFPITATVTSVDPTEPEFSSSTFEPATASSPVKISGQVSGPPNATILCEGSTDLGVADDWDEIARVTLDAAGVGEISDALAVGTAGERRYFIRLRVAP